MQIKAELSDNTKAALAGLGRVEDVHFSPSGRYLAMAGFNAHKILILAIDIQPHDSGPRVVLHDHLEIRSPSFSKPHGVCWVDERTLIVANREGEAPIFSLPEAWPAGRSLELPPAQTIRADATDLLHTPGSVAVSAVGLNLYEVLICNNYAHRVTRHLMDARAGYAVKGGMVLLRAGLEIPDGVAISRDRRWIAVSNHADHSVFMYRNTPALHFNSPPDGILRGMSYPHGVRFAADDRVLLVADAGEPHVHVFNRGADRWHGQHTPDHRIRVMDDDTFLRGRSNPQEGGPKGLDANSAQGILVVSCEEQSLAFFDISSVLARVPPAAMDGRASRAGHGEAEQLRHSLLSYAENIAHARAYACAPYQEEITALHRSRSWQLTAPLRRLGAACRQLKPVR